MMLSVAFFTTEGFILSFLTSIIIISPFSYNISIYQGMLVIAREMYDVKRKKRRDFDVCRKNNGHEREEGREKTVSDRENAKKSCL